VRARYRIAVLVTSDDGEEGFSSVDAHQSIKLKELVGPHIGAKVEEEIVALKKVLFLLFYLPCLIDSPTNDNQGRNAAGVHQTRV